MSGIGPVCPRCARTFGYGFENTRTCPDCGYRAPDEMPAVPSDLMTPKRSRRLTYLTVPAINHEFLSPSAKHSVSITEWLAKAVGQPVEHEAGTPATSSSRAPTVQAATACSSTA